MGMPGAKRRRPDEGYRKPAKKIRKFKKQKAYHSDSEDDDNDVSEQATDFKPVNMDDSDDAEEEEEAPALAAKPATKSATKPTQKPAPKSVLKKPTPEAPQSESEDEDDSDGDGVAVGGLDDLDEDDGDDEPAIDDDEGEEAGDASEDGDENTDNDDESEAGGPKKRKKRNDPTAFAESMSKILSSKLSTSKRQDPVLSRSVAAANASKEMVDARLEAKARRQIHTEKRLALEKGRVKDVLGLNSTDVSTAQIQEQERRLKKTAQRGVIKLFNAVRAAQVKAEQARTEAKKEGVVGMGQRDEKVTEMSKKGFLDLIAQGGKKAPSMNVQEA